MNNYNPFKCDFLTETQKARVMKITQIHWAIRDCKICIENGIEPEKYRDQIRVYQQELDRRPN